MHPREQHRDGHAPDSDSVRIAWNVVVATLNDHASAGRREQSDEADTTSS